LSSLTKVNVVGTKYVLYFRIPDGSEIITEVSKSDYEALAKKNPAVPTNPGGVFVRGEARACFDTVSGDIEEGQYAQIGQGYLLRRIGDARVYTTGLSNIQNGVIVDEEGIR